MFFCFRKINQISTYVLFLVNRKSTKLKIPNLGFCRLFINVEIIISKLSMENIISIKKPSLSKNGFCCRKMHHNSTFVFCMVNEKYTTLKIPNVDFHTLYTNMEIIISKLSMENIISIKKPFLSKNGILFQKNAPQFQLCTVAW